MRFSILISLSQNLIFESSCNLWFFFFLCICDFEQMKINNPWNPCFIIWHHNVWWNLPTLAHSIGIISSCTMTKGYYTSNNSLKNISILLIIVAPACIWKLDCEILHMRQGLALSIQCWPGTFCSNSLPILNSTDSVMYYCECQSSSHCLAKLQAANFTSKLVLEWGKEESSIQEQTNSSDETLQDTEKVELKVMLRFLDQIPERKDTITKIGTRGRGASFARKGMRSLGGHGIWDVWIEMFRKQLEI